MKIIVVMRPSSRRGGGVEFKCVIRGDLCGTVYVGFITTWSKNP